MFLYMFACPTPAPKPQSASRFSSGFGDTVFICYKRLVSKIHAPDSGCVLFNPANCITCQVLSGMLGMQPEVRSIAWPHDPPNLPYIARPDKQHKCPTQSLLTAYLETTKQAEGGERDPLHIKDSRATPSKKHYRIHKVVERREGTICTQVLRGCWRAFSIRAW